MEEFMLYRTPDLCSNTIWFYYNFINLNPQYIEKLQDDRLNSIILSLLDRDENIIQLGVLSYLACVMSNSDELTSKFLKKGLLEGLAKMLQV